MISDGWGFNHLQSVSYYEYGKDARQIYNRLPFQFAMSTYSWGLLGIPTPVPMIRRWPGVTSIT